MICRDCDQELHNVEEKSLSGDVELVWMGDDSWVCEKTGNEHVAEPPDITHLLRENLKKAVRAEGFEDVERETDDLIGSARRIARRMIRERHRGDIQERIDSYRHQQGLHEEEDEPMVAEIYERVSEELSAIIKEW